jgi:RNA polymerase sigma-70 factor, ECF subfamily
MRIWPHARSAAIELSESAAGSFATEADQPGLGREAFRAFYGRTNGPLWAYLLRVSGRRDAADDLLQESYCRFLAAKLPEMDAAESKSYLFKIATNLLHDRWRSRELPGKFRAATRSCEDDSASCEDDLATRADVRRAFEKLQPRERQLLWLAHVEGFGHSEIARLTGLKVGSIRVLLFRARRELAGILREHSRSGPKAVGRDRKTMQSELDRGV